MYSIINKIDNQSIVNKEDSSLNVTDSQCQICFDPLSKECVRLNCIHKFCYDCLLESYRGTNCNFTGSRHHRICPLCRKIAPFLPIKEGMVPIKGIHREFAYKSIKNFIQCKGIIKSGPNKNKQCGCKSKPNQEYCGKHKSMQI